MHPLLFVSTLVDAGVFESLLIVHSRNIAYATVIVKEKNRLLLKLPLIDYRAVASFNLHGAAVLSLLH